MWYYLTCKCQEFWFLKFVTQYICCKKTLLVLCKFYNRMFSLKERMCWRFLSNQHLSAIIIYIFDNNKLRQKQCLKWKYSPIMTFSRNACGWEWGQLLNTDPAKSAEWRYPDHVKQPKEFWPKTSGAPTIESSSSHQAIEGVFNKKCLCFFAI